MTSTRLKYDHSRPFPTASNVNRRQPRERVSDVWPDWSSELSEVEIEKSAEKNKAATVLWEAVRAVAVSVGMVILLMAVLSVR
jgi:hypothetical protein